MPGVPPTCCCSTSPLKEDGSQAHNPVLDGLQCSPAGGHVQERLCSSDSCISPDEFRTVPAATSSRKPSQVPTYPAPQLWGKRGLGGQGSLGRARSRKRKRSALPVRSGRPCWSSGGGAEVRPGSPRRRRSVGAMGLAAPRRGCPRDVRADGPGNRPSRDPQPTPNPCPTTPPWGCAARRADPDALCILLPLETRPTPNRGSGRRDLDSHP